jgi:hypothetical protein
MWEVWDERSYQVYKFMKKFYDGAKIFLSQKHIAIAGLFENGINT